MGSSFGLEVTQRDAGEGLHVSRWENRLASAPRHPAAAHRGFELSWVHRGQVEYVVAGRSLVVGARETIVVPEGVEHETRVLPGTVATSIKLAPAAVEEACEDFGPCDDASLLPRDAHVELLGHKLWTMLEATGVVSRRGRPTSAQDLAQTILRRTLGSRRARSRSVPDARVRRALDLIEARFSDELDVDDMAKAAGMSRFHFTRSFRRAYGASPYQWLIRRRVEEAALLLRKGHVTVTEAAMEVGFADLGRFSRAFRAHLGCAPSSFAA